MKMIFGICTRPALLFLIAIASIEGTIQLYYSVYWGFFMNLAIESVDSVVCTVEGNNMR